MTEYTASMKNQKRETWEWVKSILVALIVAFLIRTFLAAPFVVDGHSMDATLQNGERLIVNRLIYDFHPPQKGDIIVFHATPTKDYIKRVIAVAGDTVQARNDVLYINGQPQQEPYLDEQKELDKKNGQPFTADFGPVTVPTGQIFAMGDNRPNSYDSRAIGPVDIKKVIGRAEFGFWPLNQMKKL
jgi:signal peptidase I